jgi:transposase
VHKESISICVRNSVGKIVMESVIETKASMIVQFIDGLRGDLQVTFEEGTSAVWLYDLLKPHVTKLVVCDPRKNKSMREGNQNDKIDARRLAELLRLNHLTTVYHGEQRTCSFTVGSPCFIACPCRSPRETLLRGS